MAEVTEEGAFDPAEFEDELAVAAGNLEVGTRLWFQNDRIKGWDACLCFEAGELTPDGAVKVRRYQVGDTQYSEHSAADPMIHDLENIGETTLRFVTVELLD